MAVWNETTTTEILSTRRIDAEFSQPHYVEAEKRTRCCRVENLGKLGLFVPGPFGSAFRVRNYDFQSPYRYIRGQDVKPFFILDEDRRFIPEADFVRLKHYAVRTDDVMISVVGTLGNVAVCTERETPAMFSCKSTLFRTCGIDPYYLLAFLNSPSGRLCLLRRQRGAIQMGLNIEDLKTIPVPRLSGSDEAAIGQIVRRAHSLLNSAREKYHSSQQLLCAELGLDKWVFKKQKGYSSLCSELQKSRRADADFFNPELRELWKHISTRFELRGMSNFANVLKFSNPDYGDSGFPIVTQKHLEAISPQGYGEDLRTTNGWQQRSPSAVLRLNDLLFYSVGAYLGKTNIWLNSDKAVHASFITMLRCHDEADSGFLQVMLNSQYGILQSKCFQSGTSQQYIYPKDIRKFLIPVMPESFKREISVLIVESFEAEQESKRLLGDAKSRIEKLIEEAVTS